MRSDLSLSLQQFARLLTGHAVVGLMILTIIGFTLVTTSQAQGQLPGMKPAAKPKANSQTPELTTPDPENLELQTKDGFTIACTYLGAPFSEEIEEGRKSVMPFIVIHDWGQTRRQTFQFARFLQSQGHAVIVPDLRGHGRSTKIEGRDKPMEYDSMNRMQKSSVINDIEACKKYLVQRNNEAALNIDLLTVIAVGEMCPVAAQWTVTDWSYPKVNSSGIKQAQDVKGLVLISPRRKFADYSLVPIMRNGLFSSGRGNELPLMLVWGEDDKEAGKEAKSLFKLLDKARPDVPELGTAEERLAAKTLFNGEIKDKDFSGNDLIARQSVKGLWNYIGNTMSAKVKLNAEKYVWTNRDPNAKKKK